MSRLIPVYTLDNFQEAFYIKDQLKRIDVTVFFTHEENEGTPKITLEVMEDAVEKAVTKIVELYRTHNILPLRKRAPVRNILLAINIYSYAEALLIYSLEMAAKLNAEIKILYVHNKNIKEQTVEALNSKENKPQEVNEPDEAKRKLTVFSQKFRKIAKKAEYAHVDYNFCLAYGNASQKIIEINKSYQPDLLLMGAKNPEGTENKVLGQVSLAVAEKTEIPTITVPREANYPHDNTLRIMYATDFSQSDFQALNSLLLITSAFDVKVFYVHIDLNGNGISKDTRKMSELSNRLQQQFHSYQIEPHLISNKNLFTGIQEFVDEYKINLIAFTSPRKSIFDKLLRPNHLKKMLYQSKIPLFIFRGEGNNHK